LHIAKYLSVRGVSVAVNEIFVHLGTHFSNGWKYVSAMARIPQFTDFIPAKTYWKSNEVYVIHSSLTMYSLTTYTYSCPIH
jgi:hypothetical protein